MGYSRDTFYRLKRRYERDGLDGLKELSRRTANLRNRVPEEIERAVVELALEYPAFGQVRAAAKLFELQGYQLSPAGIRGIWQRHELKTTKKRLRALEEKVAKEAASSPRASSRLWRRPAGERSSRGHRDRASGLSRGSGHSLRRHDEGRRAYLPADLHRHYSHVAICKLYPMKCAITVADLLNDRVLPFFDQEGILLLRVLTDRGTEYCGSLERHEYELYLALNDVEHTKTKSPQTNGICERLHRTVLQEFHQVALHKKIYNDIDELQTDLDAWLVTYNEQRTHHDGRTPYVTWCDAKPLVDDKRLSARADRHLARRVTCQIKYRLLQNRWQS